MIGGDGINDESNKTAPAPTRNTDLTKNSVCQIALGIGRDKSTVSREPGRGPWFASDENDSYRPYRPKRLKTGAWTARPFYSAMTAQRKAETRARESRRPLRMSTPRCPHGSWTRSGRGGRPKGSRGD